MAAAVSKNSTNVRTYGSAGKAAKRAGSGEPLAIRAARVGFRVLSLAPTPSLASRYAERLFLTARRHRRPAWEEAALASATFERIPHEGSYLPAWRWGEGSRTVLLVHGWEGRGSQLAAFVEPLVARGFSVVAFDAPGHGDAPSRTASLVEHARAVASVAAHVGPIHAVIGHSVGAAASLLASRFGFHPGRLALLSPPLTPKNFATGFARMFGLEPEVKNGMMALVESRYGISFAELDSSRYARTTTAPILVVHDVDDRVVPFSDGDTIATSAPHGTLVATSGLGHNRGLGAAEVIDEVVPFVSEGIEATPSESFAKTLDGELFHRQRRWQR